MKTLKVLILRKDEMSVEEQAALLGCCTSTGTHFRVIRIDPSNHLEHAALCEQHGVRSREDGFVLLPMSKQIPSTAMEKGVLHIALTENGMMELKDLPPPVFKMLVI